MLRKERKGIFPFSVMIFWDNEVFEFESAFESRPILPLRRRQNTDSLSYRAAWKVVRVYVCYWILQLYTRTWLHMPVSVSTALPRTMNVTTPLTTWLVLAGLYESLVYRESQCPLCTRGVEISIVCVFLPYEIRAKKCGTIAMFMSYRRKQRGTITVFMR